jgi:3-oxoacyl-[acyl-carrier-protein] synthase II
MMKNRVIITGLGIVSSIGIGQRDFWESLLAGKSGISRVEAFDTTDHPTHFGGEVKDFHPMDFMEPRQYRSMGRSSQLAIAAAKLAFDDSGLNSKKLTGQNIGVSIGTTGGESQELESIDEVWVKQGEEKINLQSIYHYPVNNIPSNLANFFDLTGPARIFTTACAAGNYGIGYGFDMVRLGKADKMIVGGADAFSYSSFTGFNQFRAVAPDKCQPFDKNRKGMMVGEGAGVLLLERLDDALARGATIYAEVLGYGLSCDAHHMTNPQIAGISECIRNAFKDTGIKAADVDYICAHGTGTRHNDPAECQAIHEVFNSRTQSIPVSSIKSMLGHTMGAASAIETIACALAIRHSAVPPTINFETPDPECAIDCVPNKARQKELGVVLNNGFAFGGNNSCLVLRKLSVKGVI